eukprot:snap_masked-scaffold_58-processed-gene-0.77-mRNA-1 protein AED:1.00 eAED:1.00 QI:0/0/0/0/1/1/2/0/118
MLGLWFYGTQTPKLSLQSYKIDKNSEGSDTETQENDEDKYFEETPNEISLARISITINEISLAKISITINEIKIQKNCTCRFKENSLKSLVDSGATGHVTNNKNILKNPKTFKKCFYN